MYGALSLVKTSARARIGLKEGWDGNSAQVYFTSSFPKTATITEKYTQVYAYIYHVSIQQSSACYISVAPSVWCWFSSTVNHTVEKLASNAGFPIHLSPWCPTDSPKDGVSRGKNCKFFRLEGSEVLERGCLSNSNINSSTVNMGMVFRWTTDIHIFVQFLPQSGCDKMPANANSEYNLAAARSAFSLSQTPF